MIVTTSHKNGKWMQKMDLKKGAFTAQAKRAKMSTKAFASHVKANPGKFTSTTRRRAALAMVFAKHRPKKKK